MDPGCLRGTTAGSRAAVYRTRADKGIAGFFDFSSDAFAHPDLGWPAFGRPVPLPAPVPREAVLRNPTLEKAFRHIQGRRWLPPDAQDSFAQLVGPPPPFAARDEALPAPGEDWRWMPARPGRDWGVEGAMRDAIANHRWS